VISIQISGWSYPGTRFRNYPPYVAGSRLNAYAHEATKGMGVFPVMAKGCSVKYRRVEFPKALSRYLRLARAGATLRRMHRNVFDGDEML
jgi:hypothetical protein